MVVYYDYESPVQVLIRKAKCTGQVSISPLLIVREFDGWMDDGKSNGLIRMHLKKIIKCRWNDEKEAAEREVHGSGIESYKPTQAGLCILVYKEGKAQPGYLGYDTIYVTGFVTVFIQLRIAAIPCG